jgi:hypothetical protein
MTAAGFKQYLGNHWVSGKIMEMPLSALIKDLNTLKPLIVRGSAGYP